MELLKRLGLTNGPPAEPHAPPHGLFFVRGHPRSGTNWVGALLNLHPQINCVGEFHFEDIRSAFDLAQSRPWQLTAHEPARTILDECFDQLVRRCILAQRQRKPEAYWLGDRTSRPLRVLVPGSPHILIVRDGRDVLVSWTYHVLRMEPQVVDVVVPPDLRDGFESVRARFQLDPDHFLAHPHELLAQEGWVRRVARRWQASVLADMEAVQRIRAGGDGASTTVHIVRYEELRADAEAGRRAMYEFLRLDPADAAPLSSETRTTPGFDREDPTSFWRHGQVGDWKRYAHGAFARWFTEEAGEALIELGYEGGMDS